MIHATNEEDTKNGMWFMLQKHSFDTVHSTSHLILKADSKEVASLITGEHEESGELEGIVACYRQMKNLLFLYYVPCVRIEVNRGVNA